MKLNSSLNVNVKENDNNNQNLLYKLFKSSNIIKVEYIISTIISIFSLTYYSMNAGYISYNLIINNNIKLDSLNSDKAYLSSYRDFSDGQWKFIRDKYFTYIFLLTILIPVGRLMKNVSITYYKIYLGFFGIIFSFYLIQLRVIYILLSSLILYNIRFLQDIIINEKIYILINYIILFFIKVIFEYFKNNHDINDIKFLKNFPKIDNVSWQCLYLFSLFKMISFNMEYKTSCLNRFNKNYIEDLQKAKEHCTKCSKGEFCSECLDNTILDKEYDFSFLNYICYIFYPYLLFNGPIIHYNSFIFQINNCNHSEHNNLFNIPKLLYLLKYILLFLIIEFYNHYIYSVSIFKNINDPQNYLSLFYYCFLLLHVLIFIYIKWSFIWKTGAFYSYYDGIYIQNNSKIIIFNNVTEFFRGWNISFHRWILKYVYEPLEGDKNKIRNIFIIFGFMFILIDISNWNYFIIIMCCAFLFNLEIYIKGKITSLIRDDYNNFFYIRYLKYLYGCISFIFLCSICLSVYGLSVSNILSVIKQTGGIFYFVKIIIFMLPIIIMSFFIKDFDQEYKNEYKRLYF